MKKLVNKQMNKEKNEEKNEIRILRDKHHKMRE